MDHNHKDDPFREKLGNFSREPDPHVWDRIEESLNKKRSRRLLPLWWSLAGAAALILLGIFLIGPRDGVESQGLPVTETEQPGAAPGAGSVSEPGTPEKTYMPDGVADTGNATAPTTPDDNEITSSPPGQDPEKPEARKGGAPIPVAGENIAVAATEPEAVPSGPEDGRAGQRITENPVMENKVVENRESREQAGQDPSPEEKKAEKSIYEAIAESESEVTGEKPSGRWTVGTNVAPVYYNSFGSGSPISQNFVSNSKSGTLNFSYGLSVSYDISERISLRSGINKVDFGYNTNEIAFTSTLEAAPSSLIRSISYSENAKNVVVGSMAQSNNMASQGTAADVAAQSPAREGRMLQQFGYLEVPLEMEYRLLGSRLGLNLVGGMSSLFLIDNSVSLDSSGASTQIGEATNMNPVSFSTNVGLGVSYKLNTSLQVELQPMFKYHLNAFTETAGDFRPYSIGVYSGIRYRF